MSAWFVVLGRLIPKNYCNKRRPQLSIFQKWCVTCRNQVATINYVFLHSDNPMKLWFNLLKEARCVGYILHWINHYLLFPSRVSKARKGVKCYGNVILCLSFQPSSWKGIQDLLKENSTSSLSMESSEVFYFTMAQ